MPSIFAPQTPVTNDTGAVTLGFEGAPNVLYDRTMVGNAAYTISTAGTTGGETMSVTLRGPYAYSFASSVAINWAGGTAPTPACSASAFDRLKFEVLQDGALLGTPQALGAAAPAVAPAHYLNVSGLNQNAYAPASAANDGSDSFLSIMIWLNLTSTYSPSGFSPLVTRWEVNGTSTSNSQYLFGITTAGFLEVVYYKNGETDAGNGISVASTEAISPSLANAAGLWLRADLNAGNNAVNNIAPGIINFYTAPGRPSPNWNQLGTSVAAAQTGLIHNGGNSAPIIFGDNHLSGWDTNVCEIYEAVVSNSVIVLANPNFQAQSTTASGGNFIDTAATPNNISLNTNIS